ncbi:MAG: tetratricopeptide repeat protein [Candidatus Gastranaerophilaceae bacterium]|jgi:tetratricopeptide (TPR) repeat protein|nr:tetratricopeptide repeat protein [Candidatus Gastranaerophilaceae bacterium]
MKKAFLLVCILTISVITTACINNFAVQELNTKAMKFMEQGDYPAAIERLKSSVDLDDSIFESHYNLAVAYTKTEDYANAMKSYQKAISLKPEFADSYYSLAVAEENLATDLKAGVLVLDDSGELKKVEYKDTDDEDDIQTPSNVVLSDAEKVYIKNLLKDAVKNYNLYLSKTQNAEDTDEVKKHIASLEEKIDPVEDNTAETETQPQTAEAE